MMIGRAATIGPASSSAQGHTPLNRNREDTGPSHPAPAASTALVPQAPPQRASTSPRRGPHNDAAFITHLIATAEQAPQTRNLRRASLADAMAGYRAATYPAGPGRARSTSRLA